MYPKHSAACSWQPDSQLSNTIAPKWNLQTAKESQEHEDTIKKLESKLRKLKQRPNNHYSYKRMPEASQSILSSESDIEDSIDSDGQAEEEQEEGLPLLWKSRSTALEDIPKKTEDQYNHAWPFITCCFNC
ncbi:uncharacterized protein ATC70_010684 [Mucor velutinosus]|uniref:Uncharacterized protein n=1 Tax=Mucor velutinosus TaxID=708070 RepID=A0AAN7DE25_9FUNG|nr:hypothetical protein ATC70_010684 [Mucor velutinosus]